MTKAERLERDRIRLEEMKVHEDELRSRGYKYIAGIDEVGRGPLAGPVYAACVVLPESWDVTGINDSKKLSAKKREELSDIIKDKALAYGIGISDSIEIDSINILEATKNAMKRAVAACNEMLKDRTPDDEDAAIDMLLIDAVKLDIDTETESIIKGDEKSLSIAAASIVAKVARDAYMSEMDSVYPGYDFAANKGYGTARHYEGLRAQGYTPIHRRSFLKKFEQETNSIPDNKQDDGRNRQTGAEAAGSEERFPEGVRAYVDGSYDVSTGRFSCGVVMIRTCEDGSVRIRELKNVYDDAEASKQRNVAGEIMGAKTAIDFCLTHGIEEVEIYHDYEGVAKWPDREWKARNYLTKAYADYVRRARERMKITFVKVTAHTGNKYNELADKLAKEALGIRKG